MSHAGPSRHLLATKAYRHKLHRVNARDFARDCNFAGTCQLFCSDRCLSSSVRSNQLARGGCVNKATYVPALTTSTPTSAADTWLVAVFGMGLLHPSWNCSGCLQNNNKAGQCMVVLCPYVLPDRWFLDELGWYSCWLHFPADEKLMVQHKIIGIVVNVVAGLQVIFSQSVLLAKIAAHTAMLATEAYLWDCM